MRRFGARLLALAAMVGMVVLPAAAAWSAEATIQVAAPPSVSIGQWVQVAATISTADGAPVNGAILVLSFHETFVGEDAWVELDRRVSGPDGSVVFSYEHRDPDGDAMRVTYEGPDPEIQAEPAEFEITVISGPQQFRPEAGVNIPWLNGWILVAIVVIVWGTIAFAASRLVFVGRAAKEAADEASAEAKPDPASTGSAWLATVITTMVVVIGLVIVTVLVRNPPTHGNLSPEGYDRTPIAFVDEPVDYLGPGVDPGVAASIGDDQVEQGRALFFGRGCAGCHLMDASGGTVGGRLSPEDVDELIRDVRRGPGGMPAYGESVVSDEDIALIYAYLQAVEKGNDGG